MAAPVMSCLTLVDRNRSVIVCSPISARITISGTTEMRTLGNPMEKKIPRHQNMECAVKNTKKEPSTSMVFTSAIVFSRDLTS